MRFEAQDSVASQAPNARHLPHNSSPPSSVPPPKSRSKSNPSPPPAPPLPAPDSYLPGGAPSRKPPPPQSEIVVVRTDEELKTALHELAVSSAHTPEKPKDNPLSKVPTAKIRFRPQDNVVAPQIIHIPQADIGTDLSGPRLKTFEHDRFRAPVADTEGNYIFNLDDPRQASANCYASAYTTLQLSERYLGRSIKWGFERKSDAEHLWIHPHAEPG